MGFRRVLFGGILLAALAGCHNQPKQAAAPPRTTQDACAQVHGFFARHDMTLENAKDMSAGCEFRMTAPSSLRRDLGRELAAAGWRQEGSAWLTPATRCAIAETPSQGPQHPVHGGVEVMGGTHISPSFGFGIGIGSYSETTLDYKIDCRPVRN